MVFIGQAQASVFLDVCKSFFPILSQLYKDVRYSIETSINRNILSVSFLKTQLFSVSIIK